MRSSEIVLRIVKAMVYILILVLLVAGATYIGRESYDFGYRIYAEEAMTDKENAKEVSLSITENMTKRDIAELICDKGLCRSASLFYVQLMLSDYKDSIKQGLYTLNTSMNHEEILWTIGGYSEEEE